MLTQIEADRLIEIEKIRVDDKCYSYPALGGKLSIPLISTDGKENFFLDIHKARINLLRGTYQTRARQVIPLIRLDFGGAPHTNPDGEDIPCPHLHIYREGFGDKWAIAAPLSIFMHLDNYIYNFR
ncbi:conserved hypothetical protein [Chloroherpeton thalassium ATCC 35110]|uniref:Uncharacterized protein n=1 Tax=Chloroherpeton thalassium (strain ATCC 35110 / GB-78) TaxID=517418 RepID=B3QYC2_CHLT3|nr:hypothetical protein [Chloroherpeton thalassium]ACF15088.1 conserved hypothetical protein [Chloroherpeton thalassium ATCC 35110]